MIAESWLETDDPSQREVNRSAPMTIAIVLAVAALVIAPLGAYLVAARQFSGKIATSDAAQLWEESRSIRDWSQNRIKELTQLVGQLEGRVAEIASLNDSLRSENAYLLQTVGELKKENSHSA